MKGLAQTSTPRLEINLTTTDERSAAEQAADLARKNALAQQNALPVWHTNSTVSGEATALGARLETATSMSRELSTGGHGLRTGTPGISGEDDEKKMTKDGDMNDELRNYYALMALEKKREDEKLLAEEEEEEDDEDDDDDSDDENEDAQDAADENGEGLEFEEVPVLTPSASQGDTTAGSSPRRFPPPNTSKDLSAHSLDPNTPHHNTTNGASAGDEADRLAKRARMDREAAAEAEGKESEEDEDEDEAEVDFEDV